MYLLSPLSICSPTKKGVNPSRGGIYCKKHPNFCFCGFKSKKYWLLFCRFSKYIQAQMHAIHKTRSKPNPQAAQWKSLVLISNTRGQMASSLLNNSLEKLLCRLQKTRSHMCQTQAFIFALREENFVLDKHQVLDKERFMGSLITSTIPVVHSLFYFQS